MSYPKHVVDDLGELAGYLLQPPKDAELDANGCFSKEACARVDKMVLADLGPKLKGFYMPAEPARGTDPNNRWRTVSCLQKAIRFGDTEMAKFAASAAYDMDRKYLMRRLGICAIEDVGAGSLYSLLAVLAASSSQAWREAVDERRLACFLAEMLAQAPKDRSACELLVLVDFDRSLADEKLAWRDRASAELGNIATSYLPDMNYRMCAAWLMAGTKKFWGMSMPKENDRPATPLFALMAREGMSRAMLYAAAKVASRLNEGMFVSLLFMDQWLRNSKDTAIIVEEIPPAPKVGKLLDAAYDMHTREGRVAIAKFKRENKALLEPYVKFVTKDMEDTLLWFGVFVAEGGVLARRLVYGGSGWLHDEAIRVELAYPGLPDEMHEPYIDMLRGNLPVLNKCREKVLLAVMKDKG